MDLLTPAPPGMIPNNLRYDKHDFSSAQGRQKPQDRLNKASTRKPEYKISVTIYDDGNWDIQSSHYLKHLRNPKNKLMEPVIKHAIGTLREQGLLTGEVVGSQAEDLVHDLNNTKTPSWENGFASLSAPMQMQKPPSHMPQKPSRKRRLDGLPRVNSNMQDSFHPLTQGFSPQVISHPEPTNSANTPGTSSSGHRSILVCDNEGIKLWMGSAFRSIQQSACRTIAKEWIRLIHPKKQSTHPYNGNYPRNVESASPERTKPPYWPEHIRHKEPDHIDKDDRTELLVHMLMGTPQPEVLPDNRQGRTFTAEDLREVLIKKKEEFKDKWVIVEQVVQIRTHLERYAEDELDAETRLLVPDYPTASGSGSNARKSRKRSRKKIKIPTSDADFEKIKDRAASSAAYSSADTEIADSDEDDNDDTPLRNASFSSEGTESSGQFSASLISPKAETFSNGYDRGDSSIRDQYEVHVDTMSSGCDRRDFSIRDPHVSHIETATSGHMPYESLEPHRTWRVPRGSGMQNNAAVQPRLIAPKVTLGMMDPAPFDQGMYTATRSSDMNNPMGIRSYNGQIPYGLEYDLTMEQHTPYRQAPAIEYETANHPFYMLEDYARTSYPQSVPLPEHQSLR